MLENKGRRQVMYKYVSQNYVEEITKETLKTDKYKSAKERAKTIKDGIYDSTFGIDKLSINKDVQKLVNTYIHGVNIKIYTNRKLRYDVITYPGVSSRSILRSYVLNPIKGYRFFKKHILRNLELSKSLKYIKTTKGKVYFKSSKKLSIPIFIDAGVEQLFSDKEIVASVLFNVYKWVDTTQFIQILKYDYIETVMGFVPVVGNILSTFFDLYLGYISRIYNRASDGFVKSVGYGTHLASFVKKSNYSYVSNTGILRKIGGYMINYLNMLVRYVYPLHWLAREDHPSIRIKTLETLVDKAEKVYSLLNYKQGK